MREFIVVSRVQTGRHIKYTLDVPESCLDDLTDFDNVIQAHFFANAIKYLAAEKGNASVRFFVQKGEMVYDPGFQDRKPAPKRRKSA